MNELVEAGVVLVALAGSTALGLVVQSFLAEHHRSRETTELVRLVVAMLVTQSAQSFASEIVLRPTQKP